MDKIKQRALTYSLLAHVRGKGNLVGGPIQVFVPLIKRTLSKLNDNGVFSGKSIVEIKTLADELYAIDFPIPVLRTILTSIAKEVNTGTERKFSLFQDDAFQIQNFAFTEFEETINIHKLEIDNLEKLFKDFCQTCGENSPKESSILAFIEHSKFSLSKYLAHKEIENNDHFNIEAQFVTFFRQIPSVYEMIRKIYLGSLLSGYIEYKTENVKTGIELLFDTNFILGFLDLNTPESTHTCRKVLEITKKQGYVFTVLKDTLLETTALLKAKAENFEMTFLQKKVYPEDIYNACERRNLNKADLERIADKLESEIQKYGVGIIHDTTKLKNIAKFSKQFENLKRYRHNERAALHDATAIQFVKEKRKKNIKDFENVNCWFINNATNREKYGESDATNTEIEFQPETIKADDFLNIIWLSNPNIESTLDSRELTDIGLSSLISLGLNDSLPKLSIIRELDDNIQKYASDNEISDGDLVRIATRITTKQLTDIEKLNKLAKENKEQFIKRLNEEAKKQRELEEERIKKLDEILKRFSHENENLHKIKSDFEAKSKTFDEKISSINDEKTLKDKTIQDLNSELEKERLLRKKDENKIRAELKEGYVDECVVKWQKKTINELLIWAIVVIAGIVYFLWSSNWDLTQAIDLYSALQKNIIFSSIISIVGLVFSAITIKKWYDKNHNHSNIENYKKSLKIPNDFKDVE